MIKTMSGDNLIHRELTKDAQMFVADIAKDLETKVAENANSYFLLGRSLLEKKAFNKINDDEHEPVHGFAVVYGPFDSKKAAEEFVVDYPENMWPGHNDWTLIRPGKAHILTHYFDPANSDIVHNKTHEFQGQMMINEMQRRAAEIEQVQDKLKKAEEKPETLTSEQLEIHRNWQVQKLADAKKQLAGMESHLKKLQQALDDARVREGKQAE